MQDSDVGRRARTAGAENGNRGKACPFLPPGPSEMRGAEPRQDKTLTATLPGS